MSQTIVPISVGAQSYLPGEVQQTIRKCIASKSDKLADFIRRFGSAIVQHCKKEYKVEIILSENNVLLAGLNSSNIEACETYVKLYIKERRRFVRIPSQRWPLTKKEIRYVTDVGKCVVAMHSLDSVRIHETNLHRWLNPYGSLEFRINEAGSDVNTDLLILLTDDKFSPLCCTDGKSIAIKSKKGNIQDANAEVIVNTTTTALTFSGKCGSAIKVATGEEIEEECRNRYPNGIPECSVVYTWSYKLKKLNDVKYIFHTALPKYTMFNETKVKEVVKKCLYLAEELDCKSIAIPALGVGGLGYPRRESAFYTYEAIKEYGLENLQTNLCTIQIILSSDDEATCKAFDNEESRRRQKIPLPSTPVSYGAPILRRCLEQRPQTCVRIMLTKAATCPAYAVKIKFKSGVSSIEIIDARKQTWNDSIKLPIQIGTDVQQDLAKQLYEERITHLIWNLETKMNIPTQHLVSKIVDLLENMAGSEHLKYLRIVDVLVNESMFDGLKAELTNWEITYETEEPTHFLELIAESRESLKSAQGIVGSILHERRQIPTTSQTSDKYSKASALSTYVPGNYPSKRDHENTSKKLTLQADLPSSSRENKLSTKDDPTYDTIDESNVSSATKQSTENSEENDYKHTYETIADVSSLQPFNHAQSYSSSQNAIPQDGIAKYKTPVPGVHLSETQDVSVEKSTSGTPLTTSQKNQPSIFEVSACINTGIIDYLTEQDLLHDWIASVQTKYNVDICQNEAGYSVFGSLDDIVKFEHHLENGLNDLTINKKQNKQTIEEDYYSRDDIDKFLALAEQETVTFNTNKEAKRALDIHINKFEDIYMTCKDNTISIFGSPANVAKAFHSLSPCSSWTCLKFQIPISKVIFTVLQGDIRNVGTEFIAVSSTAKMTKQKGAGKNISDMLGENYMKECSMSIQNDGVLRYAECRVIKSGLCVRRWIGNVTLPTYTESQTNPKWEHVLMEAYSKCLFTADRKQCATMAMTCIGSEGGFPLKDCVDYLCQSLEALKPTHLKQILLVEITQEHFEKISRLITGRKTWTRKKESRV
ncbi:uncharacterized protein LOC127841515 isoform X2 [Dreissena polymorpha]|uniref:uncharacterized protein LOC127841515 isoform X2 n=1 Tax=Dreissena polymorpha TaxID=45954 RepID=UPI002263DE33|nr:uncharacterized protein LOC127841515 isoform X2 [Dreissena polymorpha]